MNKNLVKSIGAVLAGFFTVVVLSILTDTFLESIGFFPPITEGLFDPTLLVIALAYRTLFAFLGGFVTGKLTPNKKSLKLVKILVVIGTIMGTLGVFAGWNLSQHWYPISLVFTSAVAVWFGGKAGLKSKK